MPLQSGSIRDGMFIMPFHDPAKPLAQCYDEDLELVVRAEELGFSECPRCRRSSSAGRWERPPRSG